MRPIEAILPGYATDVGLEHGSPSFPDDVEPLFAMFLGSGFERGILFYSPAENGHRVTKGHFSFGVSGV